MRCQIVASEYLTTESYRGVAHVTVSVVSTNHVAPRFSQASYSAVIGENSSRGTAVANVTVRRLLCFRVFSYLLLFFLIISNFAKRLRPIAVRERDKFICHILLP